MADSAMANLDALIAKLKKLGGSNIAERVAQVAAPLIDAEIKKTVKAGTDPLGKPWTPKKDGSKPLQNAADHITTKATGRMVVVTLTGPDVFHHLGLGHNPRRQIIPDGASVPTSIPKAAEKAAKIVIDQIMKGQ